MSILNKLNPNYQRQQQLKRQQSEQAQRQQSKKSAINSGIKAGIGTGVGAGLLVARNNLLKGVGQLSAGKSGITDVTKLAKVTKQIKIGKIAEKVSLGGAALAGVYGIKKGYDAYKANQASKTPEQLAKDKEIGRRLHSYYMGHQMGQLNANRNINKRAKFHNYNYLSDF